MLDAKARNNMYFIEYTVKKPSQEQKHLLSAVALGFNGRYHASTPLRMFCFAACACSHCQACWCHLSAVHSWLLSTLGAVKQQFVLETAGSFRYHTFKNNVDRLNILQGYLQLTAGTIGCTQ